MSVIRRIEIRNFRSINHLILDGLDENINVFVGNNDIGKSNILRALNLFFKNETDLDHKLDFWEDFNKNIKRTSGKGQYIKITIDINLKYEVGKFVRWTKQWNNDGVLTEHDPKVYTSDGEESSYVSKSRAPGWLSRITYRYVPAIKSPLYFEHLFEELHDLMSTTYGSQFRQNTSALITVIQNLTRDITDELREVISIENKISLPANLKAFFRALDFALEKNGQKFNLKTRGDGIKTRHIPVVLNFLANKAKIYKRGALDIQTIWGFEEPENNLEMLHAFDMAKKFVEYSQSIQIFLTTHSPAFYSLKANTKNVACWFVHRDNDGFTQCTKVEDDNVNLDDKMGMLAYITPLIKEKEEELQARRRENQQLIEAVNTLKNKTKVVVLTEDESENLERIKTYLEANGFDNSYVEYYSYYGKKNINGALVCSDALAKKHPNIKYFIIHRDRDIDGDDFEAQFKKKLIENGRKNYLLLMPSGYDLESEYLSEEHIKELYPTLSIEKINKIVKEATDECKNKSLGKLFNSLFQLRAMELQKTGQNPTHLNVAKLHEEANKMYDVNTARYRYGKTVMGLVKAKIQKELKEAPNIERPSTKLASTVLTQVLGNI